jgi:hypothetical protein
MEVSNVHFDGAKLFTLRWSWKIPYCSFISKRNNRSLEGAHHQRLRSRWAARHINIHRHNPIATPRNTVTIMVITPSIRTASHRNNPSRIRHLIVDLSQRRNIGLARRSTEDYTETILIVAGSGKVHHFDGAACKSEGHGPKRALTRPVGDLVESGSGMNISHFQS